jgi:hypothetical protein
MSAAAFYCGPRTVNRELLLTMTLLEERQRKNRFTFYMILLMFCIAISFWSGYRLGRTVEKRKESLGVSQEK